MAATYLAALPDRPYCCNTLGRRLLILDRVDAVARYSLIQHNSSLVRRWLLFDIDCEDAYFRPEERDCPPPTFIAINRRNGHAHAGYLLEAPVTAFAKSSRVAMKFFDDVKRGMTTKLGADHAYSGCLAKNALSSCWEVDWQAKIPYRLDTLNDCLTKADKRKIRRSDSVSNGRNDEVFANLRIESYQLWQTCQKTGGTIDEFELMLRATANQLNSLYTIPLSHSELTGIVRSIKKWVWDRFSAQAFSRIQSARGKKAWSKAVTLSEWKPWEADGISRASWYRRRSSIK